MDSELQDLPAETETGRAKPRAFVDARMPTADCAPRIETHWSRILHYDLFAPALRGSPGEAE